jgi:AcrR family transcriptional regulator
MTTRPLGRRPGDSGARDQILAAARELFADLGFDRATIRAIARRAAVDPALVHHYFGTKDDLLAAALQLPVDPAVLFAGIDPGQGGDHSAGVSIVHRVLMLWDDAETRAPLLALLRTAVSHERAAAALGELFASTLLAQMATLARREDAPLRAALVSSHIGGLVLGRYVLGLPQLAELSADQLAATVGPVLDHYLSGDLDTVSGQQLTTHPKGFSTIS